MFALLLGAAISAAVAPSAAENMVPYARLMQGPMVGAVSSNSARIWVRTSGPFEVSIRYGVAGDTGQTAESRSLRTQKASDYTGIVELTGLRASTRYEYSVRINGAGDKYLDKLPRFEFETAPVEGSRSDFRVAFGSCARIQVDREQPIWRAIQAAKPDLFLWTGDNIYGDAEDADILREEYRRQRDVPALQGLIRTVSNLAIWDDHDAGLNNQDRTSPFKDESLEVFREYWANPGFGLPTVPGVFFRYSYGAVDFFFLDGRFYRDPDEAPDNAEKTMLGKEQVSWLESELRKSQAVFKVIVSGSSWTASKGPGGDTWESFGHEKDRLLGFVREAGISGVLLISGDSHVGEINVIKESERGGYDLYDLVSSPLAQPPGDNWLEFPIEGRVRPVYFAGPNFGVIDFRLAGEGKLTFELRDATGRRIWEPVEVRAEDLVNGVRSWPDKINLER